MSEAISGFVLSSGNFVAVFRCAHADYLLHNNHHRFPRDAYISHAWYEFDLNGLVIRGLEKLGLVYDVVDASKHHVNRAEGAPAAQA